MHVAEVADRILHGEQEHRREQAGHVGGVAALGARVGEAEGDPPGEDHPAQRDGHRAHHPKPQGVVTEHREGHREQVRERLPGRRAVGVERRDGRSACPTPAIRTGRNPGGRARRARSRARRSAARQRSAASDTGRRARASRRRQPAAARREAARRGLPGAGRLGSARTRRAALTVAIRFGCTPVPRHGAPPTVPQSRRARPRVPRAKRRSLAHSAGEGRKSAAPASADEFGAGRISQGCPGAAPKSVSVL